MGARQPGRNRGLEVKQWKIYSHNVKLEICRHVMAADFGKVVILRDPTRTLEANAKLHAMLSDIAKQAQYMGKPRTIEFWKGLFVSGWQIATGQKPEIVPGLEGEFINIRESTATMSGKRLHSVIEYVNAWAAMNEIKLSAGDGWE